MNARFGNRDLMKDRDRTLFRTLREMARCEEFEDLTIAQAMGMHMLLVRVLGMMMLVPMMVTVIQMAMAVARMVIVKVRVAMIVMMLVCMIMNMLM